MMNNQYLCDICKRKNGTRYYCSNDLNHIDICDACVFQMLPFLFLSIEGDKLKSITEVIRNTQKETRYPTVL